MVPIPEYLDSGFDHSALCRDKNCPVAVKQNRATGRWYITMGHPGFNTVANNSYGYRTEELARKTIIRLDSDNSTR